MLSNHQKREITLLVEENLDRAEATWRKVGKSLVLAKAMDADLREAETLPSNIPGHGWVSDDNPVVDSFIAVFADMRNSSGHLLQAISRKIASVSQLERVYYETSALLPALARTIGFHEGKVTEYLGDGILSLFGVKVGAEADAVYAAYDAAEHCIGEARTIVNIELTKRYELPNLEIGIGMSYSKAIVALVGLVGQKHPKVFGECVYRAAKLSKGRNEIVIDQYLRTIWPKSKGGGIRFISRSYGNVDGYVLTKD